MEREAELVYKTWDEPFTEGHTPLTFVRHLHYVVGMKGAVAFSWREMVAGTPPPGVEFLAEPMGMDVGYHRPDRTSEWQSRNEECIALGGKPCYSDGSSLRAEEWLNQFLARDRDEAWLREKLSMEYHAVYYGHDSDEDVVSRLGFSEVLYKVADALGLGE